MAKSFYDTLGVSKTASDDEIKKAYRNLAKKHHPDLNGGDDSKFKEISEAYDTLSDPQKRAAYDNPASSFDFGSGGFGSFSGFGSPFGGGSFGFDDIINMFNGGGRSTTVANNTNGDDLMLKIALSFEEAAFGAKKEVSFTRLEHCDSCHGSGGKDGSQPIKCSVCGGSGTIRTARDTPFGRAISTSVCTTCGGLGKVVQDACNACNGKGVQKKQVMLTVPIPSGVDNQQQLTVRGEGDKGRLGGVPGNLILQISVKPHKHFKRKNLDLYIDMPISFIQATLGEKVFVPTLQSKLTFTLPEGTQTGTTFKLKGQGITDSKGKIGDLMVTVEIEIPKTLTKDQKETLKKLQESIKTEQYAKLKDFAVATKGKSTKKE